jgi:PAS domain S-box-containing protein
MTRAGSVPNFSQYRTVGEAAAFLGVSAATLRNWDRTNKLKPRRHPQNGYRIYLHEDLDAVLRSADLSTLTDEAFAPAVDWSEMSETEHFVQFYESDEVLVGSVSEFVRAALAEGQASVVIATPEHRDSLERRLLACGFDAANAIDSGRYIVLDAAETLSRFMVEGAPDARRFADRVGGVIAELAKGGQRVHAFGEMVALLWAEGNRAAAIRLEQLWNDLAKQHRFCLFCAYPIAGFGDKGEAVQFDSVCSCHSRVIPAESYAALPTADDRLRAITLLQQKAQSLEAEIAHRKEVEKALSKRERELADFFDNATEGLHKVGPDGIILWANKAECDFLGYTTDEYVGRSITDFHADADVIEGMLEKLERGETLINFTARLRCKNGSIKHVLINSNACFENGEFAYTRCFTRDVTDQWHAEQALRDAGRRKDEFLATLAHELRNPLAPIKNAVELMKATTNGAAEEPRQIIERQVRQLMRLVDDLLDLSRITRDKIELRKEGVELSTILKSALEISRPLIDAAGHQVTFTLPERPITLNADAARLAQVFANLLNNSAKYTEPGGRIQIEAKRIGHEAIVVVRDNGVGISCDELAYVFDMFRQVDHSLERSQGGLGIGLTLVRRLVELHGGTINAQSEGPGTGAEFTVRLPLATPSPPTRRTASVSGTTSQPRRILVVDDNQDSALTLSKLLQVKGHVVQRAKDGMEAIEAVARFQPQVILMDVGMPNLNGYDATRRIRQVPGGDAILIVALTGWGQAEDIQRSTEAGCSAHMVKPVEWAALERLLANSRVSSGDLQDYQ